MSAPEHLALITHRPDGVAVGFLEADVSRPQLSVLDSAPVRGDGIFETFSLAHGRPQSLELHLDRFAASARALDLPEPTLAVWRDAIFAIAAYFSDVEEAWLKIVLTRGVEAGPAATGSAPEGTAPTGWVYAAPAPDFTRARTEGISVAVLDRGLRSDVAATSPWLLAGAKTLSYAVNRAAQREAVRRGADDVVFVSSDGLLLEGPTSTLIVRRGAQLVTPPASLGILAGTTQADLFEAAPLWGLATAIEPLRASDLVAADAAWLVSSVRHAAPIRAVDGSPMPVDAELSHRMNEFLRARRA
ncbi:aminotransferase class IV [Microcella sp.]|uniref:aminotransferase class IV n=1 Tax=Microcella sp. TaxID=1913979 RepID=UPI00391DFB1C